MDKFIFFTAIALILSLTGCTQPANGGYEPLQVIDGAAKAASQPGYYPVDTVYQLNPTFTWSPVSGATTYWLIVSEGADVGSSRRVIDAEDISGTSYQTWNVSFTVGKTYYWKVKSILGSIPGSWSPIMSFTIQDPYGMSKKISKNETVPANWVITDMVKDGWGNITGYIIKYLAHAEYGAVEIISGSSTCLYKAPIPGNWVIISVKYNTQPAISGSVIDPVTYTIKYIGNAAFGTIEYILASDKPLSLAPIPPGWSVVKKIMDGTIAKYIIKKN